jgi:hypothetical protein
MPSVCEGFLAFKKNQIGPSKGECKSGDETPLSTNLGDTSSLGDQTKLSLVTDFMLQHKISIC